MKILGIDPGNVRSAMALVNFNTWTIEYKALMRNACIELELEWLIDESIDEKWEFVSAIEVVRSYGMPVGRSVFDTCEEIGRLKLIGEQRENILHPITRIECKTNICKNARAKDANIRQALIDMFPHTGGGKHPWRGTKKEPGPLYGVSKDMWSAIAVAVTLREKILRGELKL